MVKQITSLQNPLIKNLLLLQEKPRERRLQNLIIIEGLREVVPGSGIRVFISDNPLLIPPWQMKRTQGYYPRKCGVH